MAGHFRAIRVVGVAAVVGLAVGCGDGDERSATPGTSAATATPSAGATGSTDAPPTMSAAPTESAAISGDMPTRCVVYLHGKGGTGEDTNSDDDVTHIAPTGNSEGWGARQWLYFPDDEYDAARQIVADSVDGCEQIIVNGFSNGASFAAAMYCRGETFDGRLVGIVVDDPVTDHAVDDCAPDPSVTVTLYSTGALEETAPAGWQCADGDWTCQGGETIGIEAYATALGTEALQSPFTDHQWYVDAPELAAWRD